MDHWGRLVGSGKLDGPRRFGYLNGPRKRLIESGRFDGFRWLDGPGRFTCSMDHGGRVVDSPRLDGSRRFGWFNGPQKRLVGSQRFDWLK
ncbi:hypothetical protein CDL15_Pgr012983 [Punica granatum]|uniref:Uncharacterized protein n=1 Tax=Punica granatum TaxID=22663 RepID=A0A218XGP6_PUNGR|nr:hypothetical protein CDL15_Pgr012983 [Punica granatum]